MVLLLKGIEFNLDAVLPSFVTHEAESLLGTTVDFGLIII